MERFVYFRKNEDDAYLNAVENFRGATQGAASGKVDVHFAAASATVTGNTFDKITLSVEDGKEKEVMQSIANTMGSCRRGSTIVIADKFGNKYYDHVTDVDSISLTTASLSATNAVLTTPDINGGTIDAATISGIKTNVESVTANDALTVAESGKTFIFADAAATLTLPDSGGGSIIGTTFTFISNSQGTGQKVVCADTANEVIIGALSAADNDAVTDARIWPSLAATENVSVNMNNVGQGHPGSSFTLTNIAADVWFCEGTMIQSGGSEATPFATS